MGLVRAVGEERGTGYFLVGSHLGQVACCPNVPLANCEYVNGGMARREVAPFGCEESGGEFAATGRAKGTGRL